MSAVQPDPRCPAGGCLITLPAGGITGGITSWAVRLASGLADQGWQVGILLNPRPEVQGVGPFRTIQDRPSVRVALGDAQAPDAVAQEVDRLVAASAGPVVALPAYSSAAYAAVARATQLRPGLIRAVGIVHSDIAYDRMTVAAHEPMLQRIVGVSRDISSRLRSQIPNAAGRVVQVPYGVDVPAAPLSRPALAGRALRSVYTGRFEAHQKRVLSLVAMHRELLARSISHELTLVGSGPLAGRLREASMVTPGLRIESPDPSLGSVAVTQHLDLADLFVLASRFEGLSVSMLEAMSRGCVPVVTRVSGAAEAIEDRPAAGVIVDAPPTMDDAAIGRAMADGVVRAIRAGPAFLARHASARAADRFSLAQMVDSYAALLSQAITEPPRDWPDQIPLVPDDFTVPPDAGARVARVLASLPGATVALWGAGRHTRAVLPAVAHSRTQVVAVMDDAPDPACPAIGTLPVLGARELPQRGVTDVVISSAMHEDELWSRRGELEALGLRVHRVYE